MDNNDMRRRSKAGWYYFNVIEPKRIRLVQEAGFVFTPVWGGLCDIDVLEQEMQDTVEAVQQQFCREGRIWQGQRYQGSCPSGSDNNTVVRGGSLPPRTNTYVKKKDRQHGA